MQTAARSLEAQGWHAHLALGFVEVDSEPYEVRADGELLVCEPAQGLPMAQRYFLF